ncbi:MULTISPECIES: response regulator transcription factor [Vibrio harveyi group]|uniref:response regulator transcription factor n=1 Tax=Vibrio harveyi group TaxID=717610 RepID=UPI001B8185BA|nr:MULTISPECIES: response regulator transcription factor [Vibrio harveyi group]EGQ8195179.1 response regulator transcription factor [Vibrio parahaemolyticus]MBS9834901.1 response regulator transcription factor [Vibrio alginolyticus]WHT05001.1 response regulator transcription factor [Vibrio parahaemolyticus]HBC3983372.1 response regulator transcription factor [Vibrio parahaemolyticus]
MKKVIIVDDHPVVIMAMKIMLERHGFEIKATADNGIDALKLMRELQPDIVILDIGIPLLDGLEVIRRSSNLTKQPKILVLSAQSSEHFVNHCIGSGARGFISKKEDMSEVIDALRAIISGKTYFPATQCPEQTPENERLEKLSSREMMVLQQLASGLSNKEIGERMLLSNKTISTYKTRILTKLNANSLADLIEIAKRQHII